MHNQKAVEEVNADNNIEIVTGEKKKSNKFAGAFGMEVNDSKTSVEKDQNWDGVFNRL